MALSANDDPPASILGRLTDYEADYAACQINKTMEEVDEEAQDLGDKLEGEVGRLLDEGGCGREERPDKLDEGSEEIRNGFDDGRHVECWPWAVAFLCKLRANGG